MREMWALVRAGTGPAPATGTPLLFLKYCHSNPVCLSSTGHRYFSSNNAILIPCV